jgi:hypothetical protein
MAMRRKLPDPPTTTDEDIERTIAAFTRQMFREVMEVADRAGLVAEAFIRFSTVGMYCQHVRETRGEDLKSAAKAMKVPQYVLSRFEDGDVMDLELSLLVRYTSYLELDEWFEVWARSNRRLVALLMQPPHMRKTLRRGDLDHLVDMMTSAERVVTHAPRRETPPARAKQPPRESPQARASFPEPPIEAPRGADQALQLRVTLDGVQPQVWRRILISADVTVHQLHRAIQMAMGWKDSHLYSIEIGGLLLSDPTRWDERPAGMKDSRKSRLSEYGLLEGASIEYHYDFGDGWRHQVVVERVGAASKERRLPVCLAGERACPPEDSGGPHGYEELLVAYRDPQHPDHLDIQSWFPRGFDPEAFDLVEANRRLTQAGGGNRARASLRVN